MEFKIFAVARVELGCDKDLYDHNVVAAWMVGFINCVFAQLNDTADCRNVIDSHGNRNFMQLVVLRKTTLDPMQVTRDVQQAFSHAGEQYRSGRTLTSQNSSWAKTIADGKIMPGFRLYLGYCRKSYSNFIHRPLGFQPPKIVAGVAAVFPAWTCPIIPTAIASWILNDLSIRSSTKKDSRTGTARFPCPYHSFFSRNQHFLDFILDTQESTKAWAVVPANFTSGKFLLTGEHTFVTRWKLRMGVRRLRSKSGCIILIILSTLARCRYSCNY